MKTVLANGMLAALAIATLSLAGCGRPTGSGAEGSKVGAAMPDTAAPRADDPLLTAPDAGATGTVPADGSTPPVAATPPVGTAGGAQDAAPPKK